MCWAAPGQLQSRAGLPAPSQQHASEVTDLEKWAELARCERGQWQNDRTIFSLNWVTLHCVAQAAGVTNAIFRMLSEITLRTPM